MLAAWTLCSVLQIKEGEIKEFSKEPAENNEVANFLGIPEVVLSPLEVMVESVILQRGKTFPLALPCTARQHQRLDEEI